jgi:hypothetical protein
MSAVTHPKTGPNIMLRSDTRLADDQIVTASSHRRSFLTALGGSALGATAMAAGIGFAEAKPLFEPLWGSARVLIGNSPEDQIPNTFIECPLFFDNGHFAHAFHTLDLSNLQTPRGAMIHGDDRIEPNFGPSVAVCVSQGTDGVTYLMIGGEASVTGGTGYFRKVDKAIVRCKYKVPASSALNRPSMQLIRCVDCVIILVRKD